MSLVSGRCLNRTPPPPQENILSQELQTEYIRNFTDRNFKMSLNVEVDDYGIFLSRANEVLNSDEFVSSFDDIVRDNCSVDRLQPSNKYWEYVCNYSPQRIPQIKWSVKCRNQSNPCSTKTVTCMCDNSGPVKETSTCSDGIPRTLDCTGACSPDQASCNATYSIAQDWREVITTVMYLELSSGQQLLESCKVTPMEVYLSSKWQLQREQVATACTCVEHQPILQQTQ